MGTKEEETEERGDGGWEVKEGEDSKQKHGKREIWKTKQQKVHWHITMLPSLVIQYICQTFYRYSEKIQTLAVHDK